MNIVVILANGSGQRFGSKKPKQFHTIQGKMVIEHVLNHITQSKLTDKIIIVTNGNNKELYLDKISNFKFDVIDGGDTRNLSLGNAINYVKNNYKCSKMIVCDAVRPMISGKLIDDYFKKLDNYCAVVTAQKITDSLGCYDIHQVDRERYYLMQSPEGFDFETLINYFNVDSSLTEVVQQFPADKPVYLNFEFKNNLKLTYYDDLMMLDIMLSKHAYVDFYKLFDVVTRLNGYLLSNYPSQTTKWISTLTYAVPSLLEKWEINDYEIVETSHFGLILVCESKKHGSCVVKIIPPFIGRYERERQCYFSLSDKFMCPILDQDEALSAILLKKIELKEADNPYQKENLINFFESVYSNRRLENTLSEEESVFPEYFSELNNKSKENDFNYKKDVIMSLVNNAISLYKKSFINDQLYLIHGDLHKYNILPDSNKLWAIDPIGFIAPIEIEFARYIGTELTDNIDEIELTLNNCFGVFQHFSSEEKLIDALFIDVVFRLHNSITENTDYLLTDKWLKIIETLKNKVII